MTASTIRVALVGDFDPKVLAHQAIPGALALAAASTGIGVVPEWVPTADIASEATMAPFDAV